MATHKVIEKHNPLAVHGLFDSEERAQRHIDVVISEYIKKGFFTDKTLKASDFIVAPCNNKAVPVGMAHGR